MTTNEWQRFHQVTAHIPPTHRLYRASAPNYLFNDITQQLTESASAFLVSHHITRIISLTQPKYTDSELEALDKAGIQYLHLPVKDFTAPTLDQLASAAEFFWGAEGTGTLVHCGYGHGRTGTCVTALQLFVTRGESPPEEEWRGVNRVEKDVQVDVLREYREKVRKVD
ncbi:hypothetical protein GALMADRAFT_236857 [Galerina marginata CBS 339.88]|uniref:Tyrosine specific protein phosphatases domain-containing protein n=1 Tax=Galerina marginata (strain CBS 339.88) TaxID=685588 RepID=A0A067TYN3_GALM3|nr:hypothetical protein GALMADRAFT_236857 [Galerina marginata CBS 339.88]